MEMYWILMGDIIKSRKSNGSELAQQFAALIDFLNQKFEKNILSPLTITLGDEFQGVVEDKKTGVAIILEAEHYLLTNSVNLSLRFVLNYGAIETPINDRIAHGMLGVGLSTTREIITQQKRQKCKYWVGKMGEADEIANQLFYLYERRLANWKGKNKPLAALFLQLKDYKKVATALQKSPSLMWKREHSLEIKSFETICNLIKKLV